VALKTYSGSCHCKAVQFKVEMDLSKGTNRCNCSLCSKIRTWFALVPLEALKINATSDATTEYTWIPHHSDQPNLHYKFCKTCGVRVFTRGENDGTGNAFYAVSVAALDDADPDELAASIKYVDGKHDRFDKEPADTRLL
jgi:hypothetical protein